MTKSTSGMTKATNTPLSATEICDILRIAGEVGVATLTFGALSVTFLTQGSQRPGQASIIQEQFTDFAYDKDKSPPSEDDTLDAQETLLSDPEAHEDAMIEEATRSKR